MQEMEDVKGALRLTASQTKLRAVMLSRKESIDFQEASSAGARTIWNFKWMLKQERLH